MGITEIIRWSTQDTSEKEWKWWGESKGESGSESESERERDAKKEEERISTRRGGRNTPLVETLGGEGRRAIRSNGNSSYGEG